MAGADILSNPAELTLPITSENICPGADPAQVQTLARGLENALNPAVGTGDEALSRGMKVLMVGAAVTVGVLALLQQYPACFIVGSIASKHGLKYVGNKHKDNRAIRVMTRILAGAIGIGFLAYMVNMAKAASFALFPAAPLFGLLLTGGGGLLFAYEAVSSIYRAYKGRSQIPFGKDQKTHWDIWISSLSHGLAKASTLIYFLYRSYTTLWQSPDEITPAVFEDPFGLTGILLGFIIGKFVSGKGKWSEGHIFSGKSLKWVALLAAVGRGICMGSVWDAISLPLILFVYWGEAIHAGGHAFSFHDINLNTLYHDTHHLPPLTAEYKEEACSYRGGKIVVERPTVSAFTWPIAHLCSPLLQSAGNYVQALIELGRWSPHEPPKDKQKEYIEKCRKHVEMVGETIGDNFYKIIRSFDYYLAFKYQPGTAEEEHLRFADMLDELSAKYEEFAGGRDAKGPRGIVQQYLEAYKEGNPKPKPDDTEWGYKHDRYCEFLLWKSDQLKARAEELREWLADLRKKGQVSSLSFKELEGWYLNLLNQFSWEFEIVAPKEDINYLKEQSKEPMQMKAREAIGLAIYDIVLRNKEIDEYFYATTPAALCRRRNQGWDHLEELSAYKETFKEIRETEDPSAKYFWTPIENNQELVYRAAKISRYKYFKLVINDGAGNPLGIELRDGRILYFTKKELPEINKTRIREMFKKEYGSRTFISSEEFNKQNEEVEILQIATPRKKEPLRFGEIADPFFHKAQLLALDYFDYEQNLDEEHVPQRFIEESIPQLQEATEHKKAEVRWAEEIKLSCRYENPHFPDPGQVEDAGIKWGRFAMSYETTDGKNFDVPNGIEKFFLEGWRDIQTTGGKDPKLVPIKASVDYNPEGKPVLKVACRRIGADKGDLKKGKKVGGIEELTFFEDGNEKIPYYPTNLPLPGKIKEVKIKIYPERVGLLGYQRFTYRVQTLEEIPEDLRDRPGRTYREVRDKDGNFLYYEYYRFEREERYDGEPVPWFDPPSVDVATLDTRKYKQGKKGSRISFKAYHFNGDCFDWNKDFIDPGPENETSYQIVEIKDAKEVTEWQGVKTILCVRSEDAEGNPIEYLTLPGYPSPAKGKLIEVQPNADGTLSYVTHKGFDYLTSEELESIPNTRWIDFIHLGENGRIRVFYRNPDNKSWRQDFYVGDIKQFKKAIYQDQSFDPEDARLLELYPDIEKVQTPRELIEIEIREVTRRKESLSEYHPTLNTHENYMVPKDGDPRHDFEMVRKPFLKVHYQAKEKSVRAPRTIRALMERGARLKIFSVNARSAYGIRKKGEDKILYVPTEQKIQTKHLIADEKFFDQRFARKRPEEIERLKRDVCPQFGDGEVLMEVFPQHMVEGDEDNWPASYGETDQVKFYGGKVWEGFYSGPKPSTYAETVRGTGGNIQAGSQVYESVINSGTPVARIVKKMLKAILEREEVEHPGETFFISYPEPGDITEDFKESRMIYITRGYVALYSARIVATAEGVHIVQIFVQRRRWPSSVAIGKVWIRPFLRKQVFNKLRGFLGLRKKVPTTYSWKKILYELTRCTWYYCGPAQISRFISPAAYQFFGMNPFMAESNFFPWIWGVNFLSGYAGYIHTMQKAGRTFWEAFAKDPAVFNVLTPMYTEMLFHIGDEHTGPFAATALGGDRVQARFLRWSMYLAGMSFAAGGIGIFKAHNAYHGKGNWWEFGNSMNTLWPLWNGIFTLYGLYMVYRWQFQQWRKGLAAGEKKIVKQRQAYDKQAPDQERVKALATILATRTALAKDLKKRRLEELLDNLGYRLKDIYKKIKEGEAYDQNELSDLESEILTLADNWIEKRSKAIERKAKIQAKLANAGETAQQKFDAALNILNNDRYYRYARLANWSFWPLRRNGQKIRNKGLRFLYSLATLPFELALRIPRRIILSIITGLGFERIKKLKPLAQEIKEIGTALDQGSKVHDSRIENIHKLLLDYTEYYNAPSSTWRYAGHELIDQGKDFWGWELKRGLYRKIIRKVPGVRRIENKYLNWRLDRLANASAGGTD